MAGKILLYSTNFAPELTSTGKYNGEMAEWLASQGFEVRVVTAPPYYPAWKVAEGYSARRYTKETWRGCRVWRCPIWVPERVSGKKRLLHLLSFALSSFPVMLRQMAWRPDICIVTEPPLVIAPLAALLSKLMGVKCWLHVQDFEVDAAFGLGMLPDKPWLRKAALGLEKFLMKRFDVVSSISAPMMERLRAKGVRENRLRLFPNWVDTSRVFPLAGRSESLRREFGLRSEDFVVLYSGNMGEKQGLEIVLETARLLQPFAAVRLVLCGDGAAKPKLKEAADAAGLDNVRFLPLQPAERLNELLNMADVHLLVQKREASDLVMPSKLTGMLASGRPIVATADERTAVYDVVRAAGAGLTVPPEQPVPLADAILRLYEAGGDRKELGRKGRQYAVDHLGMESILSRFLQNVRTMGAQRG